MALQPTARRDRPNIIEQIRSCFEDPDEAGRSRRHIGGRSKRERLAAIASSMDCEATKKPWVGHILALLFEGLEISVVNKIMTEGPGRYQKEWDKWELGVLRPTWNNKRGEDRIRSLVYATLMQDLITLYEGYEVGGVKFNRLSVREVCKKVKDELNLVVIKESHFRDQLKANHVPLRNLRGEAVMPQDRNTQSIGSPSTVGTPTPAPTDTSHISPRRNSASRLSPNTLNGPSRLPVPVRQNFTLHSSPGHPSLHSTTQSPSQYELSHGTHYGDQHNLDTLQNIEPLQQQSPENSTATVFPPSSGDMNAHAISPSGDMVNGIDAGFHDFQPMANPLHLMPFNNDQFGNNNSSASSTVPNAPIPFDLSNALFAFQPSSMTGSDAHNPLAQLLEQMQLLTRGLETERTARVQLEARANEADKWKQDFTRLVVRYTGLGESYKELTSGYRNQENRIESLIRECETEKSKREGLSEDMENLHQRYFGIDETIQKLRNDNLSLQSKVLALQSANETEAERVNHLQARLKKLESENTELKKDLCAFQSHNDTLRAEVANLQEKNSQNIEWARKLTSHNSRLKSQVETLQQQKEGLSNSVTTLQAENRRLQTQVAQLQEEKKDLDKKVDLIESENASLLQENKTIRIKTMKESQDRFSSCSIDSGIGESPRASFASSSSSSRKRQISITEEHEKKRHRSMDLFNGDSSTLLDPDPEESTIMSSELPIRSGSRSD